MEPAAHLIWRALSGKNGKVTIGGRPYTFSCIRTFRLRDDESGEVVESEDGAALMARILSLHRRRPGRHPAPPKRN